MGRSSEGTCKTTLTYSLNTSTQLCFCAPRHSVQKSAVDHIQGSQAGLKELMRSGNNVGILRLEQVLTDFCFL